MYHRPKDSEHERRLEQAWRFYRKVLRHRRLKAGSYGDARQAAIGLPAAALAGRGRDHVRRFIDTALADGTPLDDLILLAEELAREMRQGRGY